MLKSRDPGDPCFFYLCGMKLPTFLLIWLSFISISCNRNTSTNTSNKAIQSSIPISIMERGEKVYETHCIACHLKNGTGIPGHYPPLSENPEVNGDKEYLISVMLYGLSGDKIIMGQRYNLVMVPHDFLTDDQISDVLTYIRNSWGNSAGRVTLQEVRKRRNSKE